MSENKRFSFDDDFDDSSDIVKRDNKSSKTKQSKPSIKKGSTLDGGKPVGKKKRKKGKVKKWQIALIVLLSLIIGFIVYVFVAGGNDGPVYGERCASLLAIDKTKFTTVEEAVKADPAVNSIKIEVDCRIIKISMNFVDNTPSDSAKLIATNALHVLDDNLGQTKEEGAAYSNLLGNANGRGQYNVEFVLTSNGDTNFPMFGTKHPNSDDISFTGANVIDQNATDKALKTQTGE